MKRITRAVAAAGALTATGMAELTAGLAGGGRRPPGDQCDLRRDFRPCTCGRRAAILTVTPSSWREAQAMRLAWGDGVPAHEVIFPDRAARR